MLEREPVLVQEPVQVQALGQVPELVAAEPVLEQVPAEVAEQRR